jgi:hypothetical protein
VTLRSEAKRSFQILAGVKGAIVRGEVWEVRRYLSGEADSIKFGACERRLRGHRITWIARSLVPIVFVALSFGFAA